MHTVSKRYFYFLARTVTISLIGINYQMLYPSPLCNCVVILVCCYSIILIRLRILYISIILKFTKRGVHSPPTLLPLPPLQWYLLQWQQQWQQLPAVIVGSGGNDFNGDGSTAITASVHFKYHWNAAPNSICSKYLILDVYSHSKVWLLADYIYVCLDGWLRVHVRV